MLGIYGSALRDPVTNFFFEEKVYTKAEMDVAVTIIYNGTTQKGENKAVSTI